ncbi:hypothetical protein KTH_27510 [Thermosporothrix hazakensis]|jgi:hypothetical protein|uniref:Uncharacterized protein n=1 Tax=Thermosporothrix sp. COM3 TaxID=2490863 RepID=A0A455SQ01_9CHLR|nr:hypothetical protein KTC_44470 [Thermosporothrix sp. COM3]GCE47882.1 hypothetical protein KTH_27510 [Thermosporothrix hazakensis]
MFQRGLHPLSWMVYDEKDSYQPCEGGGSLYFYLISAIEDEGYSSPERLLYMECNKKNGH